MALGSNVGRRLDHLNAALREIARIAPVIRRSSVYETAPEGYARQRDFLNAVVEIRTALPAAELLAEVKRIERRAGRRPTFVNGPRAIDVDLLDVRRERVASRALTIPHRHLHRRRFVLEPLAEIAPAWRHPVLKESARQLLAKLPPGDRGRVRKLPSSRALSGPPTAL